MNECKVESIRGIDIQRTITLRTWFDWSIRSVQSFSYTGKMTRSTYTQVVYERPYNYPHRVELEPLEKEVEKLTFPNPKPAVRALITMLILALVFGGIYLGLPSLVTLLTPLIDLIDFLPIFGWVFLGLTAFFALWILPLLITAIVRKVKVSKHTKKLGVIKTAILKIIAVPAVHTAAAPVVQPSAPVARPNDLPRMPKVEKPLIRPLVKPIVAQPVSQPVAPAPVAPSQVTPVVPVGPQVPATPEATPEKPIE